MPPTKFQVNWSFGSGEAKNTFSRCGGHLGSMLAMFDLQVTPMLPTKFQVNWPIGLEEEAKNRFSRWQPQWPSWISKHNDSSYFDLLVILMLTTKLICPQIQEKK